MADTRKIALQALYKIDVNKFSINEAISIAFSNVIITKQEDGFIRELINGVITRLNTIDWIITTFSTKEDKNTISPWILNILRLGVFQLIYMKDRIPSYAAVNEATRLAKLYSHKGIVSYVNALLRTVDSNKEKITFPDKKNESGKYISLKYSHPLWLVNYWLSKYGPKKTIKYCNWNNKKPMLSLRINSLKTTREELVSKFIKKGFEIYLPDFAPENIRVKGISGITELEEYKNGLFYIQDEASSLITYILSAEKNETIMDICAAPGGKTTHLASIMNNTGKIYAVDINDYRLKSLENNCSRLGIKNVVYILENLKNLRVEDFNKIDRILIDAPCSNLGIIRRKPDIKWNKNYKDLTINIPELQFSLLEKSTILLKSRGVAVYSVCSFDDNETTKVIDRFLNKYPLFRLENTVNYLPEGAKKFVDDKGYFRTFPPDDDIDGFFAARLRKM